MRFTLKVANMSKPRWSRCNSSLASRTISVGFLVIGDEILNGKIFDTNSRSLGIYIVLYVMIFISQNMF